ncbi:hypothetical protein NDU88_002650 [Pleurodeles waltl]|uniref:Uncharacterized protein n=1 Tax=Pleurodeles waltl TaxID=8319 RepID=A0AAV7NH45_PLEWA|nr:hypothetical protein NDU88_002650 [Pleurodeles waltl]
MPEASRAPCRGPDASPMAMRMACVYSSGCEGEQAKIEEERPGVAGRKEGRVFSCKLAVAHLDWLQVSRGTPSAIRLSAVKIDSERVYSLYLNLAHTFVRAAVAAGKGVNDGLCGERRRRSYSTSGLWSEAVRGVRQGRRYTARCSLRGPRTVSGADLTEVKKQGGETTAPALMSPVKHYLKGPQVGTGKLGTIRKGKPGSRGPECNITTDNICLTKRRGQSQAKGSLGELENYTGGGSGGKIVNTGSITKYLQPGVEEKSEISPPPTEAQSAPGGSAVLERDSLEKWEAQMAQLSTIGGSSLRGKEDSLSVQGPLSESNASALVEPSDGGVYELLLSLPKDIRE